MQKQDVQYNKMYYIRTCTSTSTHV